MSHTENQLFVQIYNLHVVGFGKNKRLNVVLLCNINTPLCQRMLRYIPFHVEILGNTYMVLQKYAEITLRLSFMKRD